MKRLGKLEWIVLSVNTAGFAAYLVWLVRGSERIFYTQDGVLYLLPCLPFFFVFACLGGWGKNADARPAAGGEGENG